jgi:hypothetical protein
VTAQSSFEPSEALPFQMGIEVLEALEGGDGHQEVAADIPHQTLYLPLCRASAKMGHIGGV